MFQDIYICIPVLCIYYFYVYILYTVLQTGQNAIPSPFFTSDGALTLNARSPTRSILAGLIEELGSLQLLTKVLFSDPAGEGAVTHHGGQ